ncbi:hypothetical protein Ahy_A09g044541 isoform A [Arachis hypogaea]|uniref:SWIM-type domain-containing protein n=1 Tax=Arachis hypogaea TaxID=3818 RepID=A0A445BKB7_ARAHY|nr:hypothetical protein Ahy_A09g044541 isoform A [Arachis hypogaea]
MKDVANLRVYYNGEIIPNTQEGVTFVCKCPFSFSIPCTMSFIELQNSLCDNIESHMSKRVNNILYRNPVQVFGGLIQFQIMSIIDDAYNDDSEEEFKANYEVDDKNDDGDNAVNLAVQNEANSIVNHLLFGVKGNIMAEDCEFSIGIEFGSRESVIFAIKSYTIFRCVNYTRHRHSTQNARGMLDSKERLLGDQEIHWQTHVHYGDDFIKSCQVGFRTLVEADPLIKVKSIIVEAQFRHIRSNFSRRFKNPYLHKLVVNISYSRMEQEYNKNYQRLKELGEAYTRWCDEIGVEKWVLAFDGGHCWGHVMMNLVECINFALKGTRNLLLTAIIRSTFYRLNKLFTRKSVEAYECVCNGSTYLEFITRRVEEIVNLLTDTIKYLRFVKCMTILYTLLILRNDFAIMRHDCQVYVLDVYKMLEICKVYRGEFL